VDANTAAGEEPDAGVTMGLYCYPILMAADILMFNAHRVPVGKDQIQHIEMARDVATRFNHLFGAGEEFFVLPEAQVDETMELLPGLDGRKMSKSYDNVIPLFEGGEKALREAIARIVTDSKLPGEPKDPDSAHLVTIFDAFASAEERAAFRAELRAGLAWGEAKNRLFEQINRQIGPMRALRRADGPPGGDRGHPAEGRRARPRPGPPAAGPPAPCGGPAPLPAAGRQRGAGGQGQDRPARLQAVPRGRRPVLLQAQRPRRPRAAAKPGLCRWPRGRRMGQAPEARRRRRPGRRPGGPGRGVQADEVGQALTALQQAEA
jgi:tryptophanyl-tRNA synthetase